MSCYRWLSAIVSSLVLLTSCRPQPSSAEQGKLYEVVIRGGTIYDGSGRAPIVADLAIDGDRIAAVGSLTRDRGQREIDARGLAVAPGFINMLSHAVESLIIDGRGTSDLMQGVTLEVFGETSMGPLSERMKREAKAQPSVGDHEAEWTTLGEYMQWLEKRGVTPNIASFVSASTIRTNVLDHDNRAPSPEELERMRALVDEAMREGAMGVTTALIYVPANFSTTAELVELAKVASKYGGMFAAHMRNESNRIETAIDEMITIAREADITTEIYHFKLAGRRNWDKLDRVVAKIEDARARGVRITADMYTYTAGGTGFDSCMPAWVQEGGYKAWAKRLSDPDIRKRLAAEMGNPYSDWENNFTNAGPDGMVLSGFKNPALRPLIGKTVAEVARERQRSPEETIMDLVIEDGSRVWVIYFLMSENNVRRQIALPWMAFNSDAEAMAPEGVFLQANPHPRAYGTFARLLGKYVRDERVIPLEEAIRRLTSFPAENLKLRDRGRLVAGYMADVVLFDPKTIADNATYNEPQRLAQGVAHVFVNGVQVVAGGAMTGAKPGRFIRGPGWRPDTLRPSPSPR